MNNTMIVGEGTHFEKARAWVKASVGDTIQMPNGALLTITKKNPKSAACVDANGEPVNVPIKKLLPHGSDAYVNSVVRQLQDELEQTTSDAEEVISEDVTASSYQCSKSLGLARRIIRANRCSTQPKKDVIAYIENSLSKQDKQLTVVQQQTAVTIAMRHLHGDYPCPMHSDTEYAAAEWMAFDTWYFNHHKTALLINAANNFDSYLKARLTEKAYNNIFRYRRARSATETTTGLRDCLHSWFTKDSDRCLKDMDEAYEYLMLRIDSQSARLEFIIHNIELFNADHCPHKLTELLIDSPAKDLLKPLLKYVHNIEFGTSMHHDIPQFVDLSAGNVTLTECIEAREKRDAALELARNEHAQNVATEVFKVVGVIEELASTHLPYINRLLREAGCKKFTKEWDSQAKDHGLRINCDGRSLKLPVCDMDLAPMMAKQYMSALANEVNNPKLTHEELETAIDTAYSKAVTFLETLEQDALAA